VFTKSIYEDREMHDKQNMSVRTTIEDLDSIENGGDVIDYLLDSEGLNYSSFVEVPSGIKRNQGGKDWYEAHLVDESGDGVIRYIELEASGDSPAFSDLKRHLKRHGSPINELFTVITYRKSDEGPLTSPLNDDLTFLYIQEQFSSEDVEVTFDLNYFTVKRSGVEPAYLDYLDDLAVGSGQGRTSLEGEVEEVFSIREITRSFYQDFGEIFREDLQNAIHGLEDPEENLNAYTRTVVNRVLFLLFIEEKGWLNGDIDYIENKYEEVAEEDDLHVYDDLFEPLFFEALSEKGTTKSDLLGQIPFLNGGLFERKDIERDVEIDEAFFDKLLSPEDGDNGEPKGFLRRYKISLRESNLSEQELVVDPEFIGRIFEMFMQEDERSEMGAFYTPKSITGYMAKNSIKTYLLNNIDGLSEDVAITLVTSQAIPSSITQSVLEEIEQEIQNISILDPAVGSGAFIIAILEELVRIKESIYSYKGTEKSRFQIKKDFIVNNIYGVDIDEGGVELCKFRVWLYLMQDLQIGYEEFLQANSEYALPNLGFKFFTGNSLVGEIDPVRAGGTYQETLSGGLSETIEEIHKVRQEYITSHGGKKKQAEERLSSLTQRLDNRLAIRDPDKWMVDVASEAPKPFSWCVNIPEVVLSDGFDIVIGNPPYEGQVRAEYKKKLQDLYSREKGFKYYAKTDLFQFFVHRGYELTAADGVFSYIMSDTFFTNINKSDVRETLKDEVVELTQVNPDAFAASVETAIFKLVKESKVNDIRLNESYNADLGAYAQLLQSVQPENDYSATIDETTYYAGSSEIGDHIIYWIDRSVYKNSINRSFFKPTQTNLKIYERFIAPFISTYEQWGQVLAGDTSIGKYLDEIEDMISNADPGEAIPFGLLTEGGVGFQLPRNRDYIAVLEGTKKAERIEQEGYYSRSKLDKIVDSDKIIEDATELSEEQRLEGISEATDRTWVKITRESKSHDLYFCPTDKYINWDSKNVEEIKEGGYPRNDQYYLQSGIATKRGGGVRNMEWRLIEPSVFTDTNQVFVPINEKKTSPEYLLGILNSSIAEYISNNFLNRIGQSTRDVRRLPIKIPTDEEKAEIEELVNEAISIQKRRNDVLDKPDMEQLEQIDDQIDEIVADVYDIEIGSLENE